MKMTGQFRIALLPSADPQAFEEHMKNTVFKGSALQPTRITRSFSHTLLQGSMRHGLRAGWWYRLAETKN